MIELGVVKRWICADLTQSLKISHHRLVRHDGMTPSGTPASSDNVLVMIPAPSGPARNLPGTQRMAGDTVTRRAARTRGA